MHWLAGILLLVLLGLQYRLWVGDGSLAQVQSLREEVAAQRTELKGLRIRNQALEAEVQDLQDGLDALEERARSELGMIKDGELFLQVIERPGRALEIIAPAGQTPASKVPLAKDDLARGEVGADAGKER